MAKRTRNPQLPPKAKRELDFSKIGKSKRLAKQNKDYLDLLSIVTTSRQGFIHEQESLKSKPAKDAASQLLRQLDLVIHMVSLPHRILVMMGAYAEGQISVLMRMLFKTETSEDEKRKIFERQAKSIMERFFALDVSGSMSRPWLFAITVYIWTTFEFLAGDLWAASLNHGTALGHRVLNLIPNEDTEKSGLSRRHIDVGLAARHGFDLRKSLGTILKSKFDFSSVGGIEAAYKQAFGTCGDIERHRDRLKELEQVRHVIVHRGGLADLKFTKVANLKVKPDKMLTLKLSQVGNYMMSVTLACVALLQIVDDWFAAQDLAARSVPDARK